MHLCFGYAALVHERPAGYSFLPELADCPADQISIETAQSGLDLGVLADLAGKTVVLGVIDLSDAAVEPVDVVADRVRRAFRYARTGGAGHRAGLRDEVPAAGVRGGEDARHGRCGGAAASGRGEKLMGLVTEENITELAVERWGSAHDPRLAEVMRALVRHLHDFAREVHLTEDEWLAAIRWLTATGQISDDKREEFILASDVLGLSMLVVQLNHQLDPAATPATVLGPFHIEGSPELATGADMAAGIAGTPLFVHGTVRDLDGKPVAGAVLDVWQADDEGMYEAQLDVQDARLRAKYTTGDDGGYCVRTVAPLGYSIPVDGPVGELIAQTPISHYRPAHVHFIVTKPGCERLVTHLFRVGAPYLDSDVVFGVRDELVVRFDEHPAGPTPDGGRSEVSWLEARYDFVVAPTPTA